MGSVSRMLVGSLGALVLMATAMACGDSGSTQPAGPYESICQVRAGCLDDNPFDTTNACAEALKGAADISSKSGECLEATQTTFECRARNAQCTNQEVTYDAQCESEFAAQQDACGESDDNPLVGTEDFEEMCSRHKQCRTDLDFETSFGSYEPCVENKLESAERCDTLFEDFQEECTS